MNDAGRDADRLTFMMGEFRATFPQDRVYIKNHMWATAVPSGGYRFGLTEYAVRLLQDVYFLDWTVDAGQQIAHRQCIGSIESKKAESEIYSPVAGQMLEFNDETLNDPSAINVEPYAAGWLFAMMPDGSPELLEAHQYLVHLESAWEVAQKTIKGQVNQ